MQGNEASDHSKASSISLLQHKKKMVKSKNSTLRKHDLTNKQQMCKLRQ